MIYNISNEMQNDTFMEINDFGQRQIGDNSESQESYLPLDGRLNKCTLIDGCGNSEDHRHCTF